MYVQNDEIAKLAISVMETHVEEFSHLMDDDHPCRIAYMYCDKKKTHDGMTVFADTTKLNEMMQTLTGYDFVITFYGPAVDDLPDETLGVLMYHELLHVGYDPVMRKCWIIPHDIEDFECIITKYGINWINNHKGILE